MELYEAKFSYVLNNGEKPKKTTEIWMVDAVNNGEAEQKVISETTGNFAMQDLKVMGVRASGIGEVINPSGKEYDEYDADENYSWYNVTVAMEMDDKKVKTKHLVRAISATEAITLAEGEYSVAAFETIEVKKTMITRVLLHHA